MKKIVALMFGMSLCFNLIAELSKEEIKELKNQFYEIDKIQVIEKKGADLEKVFSAKIYIVKSKVKFPLLKLPYSRSHSIPYIYFNNKVLNPESVDPEYKYEGYSVDKENNTSTGTLKDVKMPTLLKVINKDFKINNYDDAVVFYEALKHLYPIQRDYSRKKEKGIYRDKDEWFFLRKVDLGQEAFGVKVDNTGTIKNIRYTHFLKNVPLKDEKEKKKKTPVVKKAEERPVEATEELKKTLTSKYMESFEVNVEPGSIDSKLLGDLFNVSFYDFKYRMKSPFDGYGMELKYNRQTPLQIFKLDGEYYVAHPACMMSGVKTARMNILEKIIKKDFVLKNKEQAEKLNDVILILTANTRSRYKNVKLTTEISKKGNDWLIVTTKPPISYGKYFAYTVSTDDKGKILKIVYHPNYKKKLPKK